MKPNEAREMRRRQQQDRVARGEALEAYLHSGDGTETVVPELIPSADDAMDAARDVRVLVRRLERTPRGARRGKLLDELIFALARLVFVERVMAMDALARAALTPGALASMSRIGPEDLRERLDRMQGVSGLELAS